MPRSPQQITDAQARPDKFAELLSLDIPIPTIAYRMGIGKGVAFALMKKLRQKYGWQAQ